MRARTDFEILWIVLAAAVCWLALWKHELVGTWIHKALNAL
jgi:hypothetical protein